MILQIHHLLVDGIVIVLFGTAFYFLYRYQISKIHDHKTEDIDLKKISDSSLLAQVFENMPDRIYFKDRNSRFLLANRFVTRVMGAEDPSDLKGKTDYDFYKKDLAEAYLSDDRRIMQEGKPMIAKEEKGLDIEGNEVWVSTSKFPIMDGKGKVVGLLGIGRDVTEQKKAEKELRQKSENLKTINILLKEHQDDIEKMERELQEQAVKMQKINEQLERLSLVASKTENTVVIMDENGNFEWVNEGFERRYKANLKDFTAKHGINLRESSSHPNISAILNQIYITRKPFTYNSKYVDERGRETWNQTNISPTLNEQNEITRLILIDSDISELKSAEARIKKQNEAIAAQAQELKKLNSTKDRLFSIIAHDLKNPFNSILGFTDLLSESYQDIEREQLRELLEMISTSTRSAHQLLENLLQWARTQAEAVKIEPVLCKVTNLIDDVNKLLNLHASLKKIKILSQVDEKDTVWADKNMMLTIIRNLVSNAIKYTPEGGTVQIISKTKNGWTEIAIIDSGVGIPEEKIRHMFSLENIQSTAGTSGETGTGLGLIVCNDFVQLNNGKLKVESTIGEGSKFTIRFPSNEDY